MFKKMTKMTKMTKHQKIVALSIGAIIVAVVALIIAAVVGHGTATQYSNASVKVQTYYDGQEYSDVAILKNGKPYVDAQWFAKMSGYEYSSGNKGLSFKKSDDEEIINISDDVLKDSSKTYIPASDIDDSFGFSVNYETDGNVGKLEISSLRDEKSSEALNSSVESGSVNTAATQESEFGIVEDSIDVAVGGTYKLHFVNGKGTTTFTSNLSKIATVDNSGVVKGIAIGSTVVTATDEGSNKTDSVKISVKSKVTQVPATKIELDRSAVTMRINNFVDITAKVYPDNATLKYPTWTTSDSKIAKVNQDGRIISVAPGKAVIKASIGSVSASVNVTVQANSVSSSVSSGSASSTYVHKVQSNSSATKTTTSSKSRTTSSKPKTSTKPTSSSKTTPSSPKPSTPTKVGSYGIIEAKDSRVLTEVGVLYPLQTTYNSASTYAEHRDNIDLNLAGCEIIDDGFVKSGDGSGAFVRFIEKNGKFGLEISAWRKSKDDNSDAGILNGALSAMVYLARSKPAGEALWAWHDAFSINGGHVDTKNYGFIDNPDGTITYKGTSNKIKIEFNPSDITFLFY